MNAEMKTAFLSAVQNEAAYPVSDYFTVQGAKLATSRMSRIRSNWKFYLGDHENFDNARRNGGKNVLYNYIRCVVDKSIRWLVNPQWRIVSAPGNERLSEFYETVWQKNQKRLMLRNMAIQGAIAGDAFVWVGVQEENGKKILRLKVLNSANVHPVIDPNDPTRMLYCVIQYPVMTRQKGVWGDVHVGDPADAYPLALFTQIITPEIVYEYVNDSLIGESQGIGFVPIVHVPNLIMGGANFGRDEVNDLKGMNLAINHVATDLKEIVGYYASPLTLVYGSTMGDIARDKSTVWSGIPVESRVESLEQRADLSGSISVLDGLVQQIHELSNTPRGSLASDQAITNVSEAALRVFFMPILEVLEEKYDTYGEGINRINKMIARVVKKSFTVDVTELIGPDSNPVLGLETRGEFSSPIPKDSTELMTAISQKLQNKLISRADALRALGTEHPDNAALEILSDMAEELFVAYQQGRAAMGVPVSFTGLAVGSLGKTSGAKKGLEEVGKMLQITEGIETLTDLYQQNLLKADIRVTQAEPAQETSEDPDLEAVEPQPDQSTPQRIQDAIQLLEESLDTKSLTPAERSKIVTMLRQKLEES